MSKVFLKKMALASTIIIILLGLTETSWGMWKQKIDEMSVEEISKTRAKHDVEEHARLVSQTYGNKVSGFSDSASRTHNSQPLISCNICKSNFESSETSQRSVLETTLAMKRLNEQLERLENESIQQKLLTQKLQKQEEEERKKREDKKKFKRDQEELLRNRQAQEFKRDQEENAKYGPYSPFRLIKVVKDFLSDFFIYTTG